MPSDQESTDSNSFPCALCNKSFVRRDLRNRHRRRCEKSIGKVKVSKKRSCEACGKSKLRCDLAQPSCSRCIGRQIPCQYPPETIAAAQNASQDAASNAFMTDLNLLTDDLSTSSPLHPFPSRTPSITSHQAFYPPLPPQAWTMQTSPVFNGAVDDVMLDGMTLDSDSFSRTSSGFWDPATATLLSTDGHAPGSFSSSLPMMGHGSLADDNLFSPPLIDQMPFPSDLISPQSLPYSNPLAVHQTSITNEASSYQNSTFSFDTASATSPEESLVDVAPGFLKSKSPTGPVLQLTAPTAYPSPSTAHRLTSPSTPPGISPTELHFEARPRALPTPRHSRPGSISSLEHLSLTRQSASRPLYSIEEATSILCNYPTDMLDKSYRSPFLHFQAHHCAEPGLPEPIANALCCVASSSHSVESSIPFTRKIIVNECERLIKEFPHRQLNLEDSWAFLHALCIYQIESMLVMRKQRPRADIMSSELHHAFLIKMAKGAALANADLLKNLDNTAMDWQRWTLIETLRRNLFLVHMINELSHATEALHGIYYEPFPEEFLVDLPLPAPESIWKARTPGDWTAARDAANWSHDGVTTLGQAMQKLRLGKDAGELEPLQRLIVSCAMKRAQTTG